MHQVKKKLIRLRRKKIKNSTLLFVGIYSVIFWSSIINYKFTIEIGVSVVTKSNVKIQGFIL